jgi:U3 small nucleolar RNA-associated protein 18
MSIVSGSFLGNSDQAVLSGRKPFYYSYDIASGAVAKILGPRGTYGLNCDRYGLSLKFFKYRYVHAGKDVKSLEKMSVSPSGSRLAFQGAAGHIHIADGVSKNWIMDLKMNTAARSMTFLNDNTLCTSGVDAQVYLWDTRAVGRCITR